MKYRLLLTLLCLLAVPVLAYGQATINVQDASTIEWGTTTIDVTVSAVPPPGVTDIQGTITFNSSIVHVIDIVGLNGFSGFFFKAIDNVLGTVTFTGAIVGGPGVTAGDILQLTVEAVGAPGESCFVDLVMTVFRHEDGTNIPHTVDHGTFTISITVPPVADFSYTPVDPTVNDIVYFTDLSDDPDGWIVGWNWTFGDGGVSILQNPTHQYVNGGAYTVTLTVIDNDGASDTISQTVTILGPSAAFTYTPTNPTTQDWVQFFDQSTDPTGDIISWSWDFGDSGVSSEQNPDHKFATPGTYRVNLTITNDSDPAVTVSTYRDITVRNAPPVADFTFDPPQPKIGEMVTFGAGGSSDPDGHIVMFEWDFNNDGVTDATGSTVTYSFGIVGARPVTLKVTDDDGASSYTTKVVPVQATAPTAVFTFTPLDPNTGQVVSFDASGSADPDGTIILYEWDFNNDGVTDATGMAVTHSFPTAGVYPVTLVVTDNDGAIDAETKGVPVQIGGTGGANQPPVANFDFEPADPPEVNLNEVVNFRANGCSDPDGTIAAYDWDFDNNGIYDATGMNVSRIFHTGGAKIVTLRVTDNDGAAGFKTRVVAVEFIRPAANFVFEPTEPREGQVVNFDGSSSSDADGRIEFYEWDFDNDGVVDATGMSVNHVFNSGGGKPVTLKVTDNDGVTDFITKTVPVQANNPPVADFTYTPASPTTDDTVVFTDASTDVDGTIVAWLWEFGDDGATSSVQTPSHKYAAANTYDVKLTVTDNEGASTDVTKQVIVGVPTNIPPVANFNFSPALSQVNQAVQFSDLSTDTDGTITGWDWNFGDGGTSTAKNPTHTYTATGTYTVTLTVTDNEGTSSTPVTKQITVAQAGAGVATHSYPNPASTMAHIVYSYPAGTTDIMLRVFDITGALVFSKELSTTDTEYLWNLESNGGDPLPNGLYFYVITAKDASGKTIKSLIFRLLIDR